MFKDSFIFEYIKKIKIRWDKLSPESFIFIVNLVFYFGLLILNPNNKLIIISFLLLFFVYNSRLKSFRLSLILCYLTSLIITSGKTYDIELVPKSVFESVFNQDGYKISFSVNTSLIVSLLMLFITIRDLFNKRIKYNTNSQKADIFLFLYFIIVMFVDAYFSKMPDISTLFGFSNLTILFAYLFIKFYKPSVNKFIPIIIALFAAQVTFESSLALNQFMASSSLNKNIESHVIFQNHNNAPDELSGRFRPTGTMSHANNLAAWMVFFVLIIFVYNYQKSKTIYFLVSFLGSAVIILTLSRGAWISYFLGTLFCLFIFEKVKKIKPPPFLSQIRPSYILLGIVLFSVFIFPRLEKSLYVRSGGLEFRENQFNASLDVLKSNLLFGVGTSMSFVTIIAESTSSYFRREPMPVHNWYLLSLIEHGLLAMACLFIFLILKLRSETHYFSSLDKLNRLSTVKLGFVAGTISMLIIAFFQPFFLFDIVILTSAIIAYPNEQK